MSDGCSAGILSGWLNTMADGAVKACCVVHDVEYTGTVERIVADWNLATCVARAGSPVLASIMGLAVAAFGWLFYKRKNNER